MAYFENINNKYIRIKGFSYFYIILDCLREGKLKNKPSLSQQWRMQVVKSLWEEKREKVYLPPKNNPLC